MRLAHWSTNWSDGYLGYAVARGPVHAVVAGLLNVTLHFIASLDSTKERVIDLEVLGQGGMEFAKTTARGAGEVSMMVEATQRQGAHVDRRYKETEEGPLQTQDVPPAYLVTAGHGPQPTSLEDSVPGLWLSVTHGNCSLSPFHLCPQESL